MKPRVSIIIAVLDDAELLEKTLLSYAQQSYKNKEIVVVDGGSTDGTLSVISKFTDVINFWVSEKDKGISDAFNKGVLMASGDYINFQGAGDTFCDSDSLSGVIQLLGKNHCDILCGRIARVDESGEVLWRSAKYDGKFVERSLLYKMSLPHQAMFMSKEYFEKYGYFDVSCRYAMDYELLLRSYGKKINVIVGDIVVSNWRVGGVGTEVIWDVFREYDRIKRKHRVAPLYKLYFIDLFTRVKYLIRNYFFGGYHA